MSLETVKAFLKPYGMEDRILVFEASSATVELAALAVGCAPKQIVKTMSFLVNDRPLLIAMAGDARIANPRFKERFHAKASMIAAERVLTLIGHDVGGVCPFAVNAGVEVYLDVSIRRFDTVYPAAGSGNSAVRLTVEELAELARVKDWVDVCKDWQA